MKQETLISQISNKNYLEFMRKPLDTIEENKKMGNFQLCNKIFSRWEEISNSAIVIFKRKNFNIFLHEDYSQKGAYYKLWYKLLIIYVNCLKIVK